MSRLKSFDLKLEIEIEIMRPDAIDCSAAIIIKINNKQEIADNVILPFAVSFFSSSVLVFPLLADCECQQRPVEIKLN